MDKDLPVIQESDKKYSRKERRAYEKSKPALYPDIQSVLLRFPMFFAIPLVYVGVGLFLKIWHPTWIMFLMIPFYYQLCHAFGAKNQRSFLLRLPVIPGVVITFLCLGLFLKLWKYAWFLFLLIPLYYWMVAFMKKE